MDNVAALTIRITTMVTDAGECPMCGFDSLRRIAGYNLTRSGVTTMFDQKYCGRCINDLRESGDA